MVKKIVNKQNVKQSVNVKVHIGDKYKKKRNKKRVRRGGSGGGGSSSSPNLIPFTPVYIQSGNAPHLEIPTIHTPAIPAPVPASVSAPVLASVPSTPRTSIVASRLRNVVDNVRENTPMARHGVIPTFGGNNSDSDTDEANRDIRVAPISMVGGSSGGGVVGVRRGRPKGSVNRSKAEIEAEKHEKELKKLEKQLSKK
jgi:hypothetical protein